MLSLIVKVYKSKFVTKSKLDTFHFTKAEKAWKLKAEQMEVTYQVGQTNSMWSLIILDLQCRSYANKKNLPLRGPNEIRMVRSNQSVY